MVESIKNLLKPGIFRFFLATLVVLFHGSKYFPYGDFAVNTFFILSGYWIFRMYDEFYGQQKNPYHKFIMSRIFRIFPLYYFCTFLALIVTIIRSKLSYNVAIDFINFKQIFSIITLIPYNYLDQKILPPAWSLGIEMQFYLLAPFLIYLIRKVDGKLFFIVLFLTSLVASFSGIDLISLTVIPYLIYFVIGMLIWLYKPLVSNKLLITNLILISLVISTHYLSPYLRYAIFVKDTMIGSVNYIYYFSNILPFLFIPLIIFCLAKKSDKKDRSLGDLSYTIYLFHWIPFSIYNNFFSNSPNSIRIPAFISYLIILILGSWVIYIFFEKRVEIFRKMVLGKI